MANFFTNTAHSIKEGFEKADLVEMIKKFFEGLRNLVLRNSISQRLDEIEDTLIEGIQNDLYTREQLDAMASTIDKLAGKLRNTTPEDMQRTADEAYNEINNLVDEMYREGRIISSKKMDTDFFTELKTISGHEEMSDEEFRKFFEEKATLLDNGEMKLENGQIAGKTAMLVELDGKCYRTIFNVSEAKPVDDGSENPVKKRAYQLKVEKFEDSYSNATEITSKANIDKYETMMRKFIIPRGLRRYEDARRIEVAKLAKTSNAIRDMQTIEKYKDTVVLSPDGKNEFTYDSKTDTFRARNKETGSMLVIGSYRNGIMAVTYNGTSSLHDIDESKKVSQKTDLFTYERNSGIIQYSLPKFSSDFTNLLRTPNVMEMLETKGVPTVQFRNSMEMNSTDIYSKGYSRVNVEGFDNVEILSLALKEAVKAAESETGDKRGKNAEFTIIDSRKAKKGSKNGAVFLKVLDKDNNTISFSFNEDGTPRDINYKGVNDKKFRLAEHLDNIIILGSEYEDFRYREDFIKLYSIMTTANTLFKHRTKDKIEKTPENEKAVQPTEQRENDHSPAPAENHKEVGDEYATEPLTNSNNGKDISD